LFEKTAVVKVDCGGGLVWQTMTAREISNSKRPSE